MYNNKIFYKIICIHIYMIKIKSQIYKQFGKIQNMNRISTSETRKESMINLQYRQRNFHV